MRFRVTSGIMLVILLFSVTILSANDATQEKRTSPDVGYLNVTTLGILTGDEQESFCLLTTHGIRFGKQSGLGIGLGLEGYDDLTAVPFFIDGRVKLLPTKTSPFLMAQFGYTHVWGQHDSSPEGIGFMARLGGGICFRGVSPCGFIIEGGYRMQSRTDHYYVRPSLDMVSISVGFSYW